MTRSTLRRLLGAGLALTAALASVPAPAQATAAAASPLPRAAAAVQQVATGLPTEDPALARERARITRVVLRAVRRGADQAGVDRALTRAGFQVSPSGAASDPATPVPASAANDVAMYRPTIVHNGGSNYTWSAAYAWKNSDFTQDEPGDCVLFDGCRLYGKDGLGLYFDRRLTMTGYLARFSWREGGSATIRSPWDRNRFGVAYRKQDITSHLTDPDDLNMYYGVVAVSIKGRPCGSTSAWSKYAHTWQKMALTDVTIGAGTSRSASARRVPGSRRSASPR
ncbi:MAG: hypothetical protein R2731_05970 [Nocardioides sp.]